MINKLNALMIMFFSILLIGCSIESMDDKPYETLVDLVQTEDGAWVHKGQDTNRDGILSQNEITESVFISNGLDGLDGQDGQDGYNSIIKTETTEEGYIIYFGLDTNRNNELDDYEITSQIHVKNGVDGNPGENGYNSLIKIVQLTEDMESECEYKGIRIYYGLDVDRDNVLDDDEIESYQDVCECECEECEYDVPYYNIEMTCCPDDYESKSFKTSTTICRPAIKITKGIVGKPELETIEYFCL